MDDNNSPAARKLPGWILFVLLASMALIVGAVLAALAILSPFQHPAGLIKEAGLIAGAGLAFAAVFVLLYLALLTGGWALLRGAPDTLEGMKSSAADVDAVWRQQDVVRTTAERIEETVHSDHEILEGLRQDLTRELSERQSLEGLLIAQLQREAEHLDQRLAAQNSEMERLKTRIERWRDSVIQIIEQLGQESTAADSGAGGEQNAALQSVSQVLAPLGLELIVPAAGDSPDPRIHVLPGLPEEAIQESSKIIRCSVPGFWWEGMVLRKAQVQLDDPTGEADEPGQEWSQTLVQKQAAVHVVSVRTPDGRHAVLTGWETYTEDRNRDCDDADHLERKHAE